MLNEATLNEVTLRFGRESHLIGTLTLPGARGATDIAYLLLNAGVIHRIGPHRFNVKLARRLASLGFPVMRFDLAGLGDSAVPRSSAPYPERVAADVRDAMEVATRKAGVQRFIVVGICSGADNGFRVAAAETRVVGVVMIDGYGYPTLWTRWHRYWRRLGHGALGAARGWFERRLALMRRRLNGEAQATAGSDPGRRAHPPRTAYADRMQALVDRGVRVLLIHSGSLLRRYSYARQFHDAFGNRPFASKVEVTFCPDVDHTVTTLAAQQQLMDLIGSWARQIDSPAVPAQDGAERRVEAA
jgi:pimeloyl-ACP methyl ester carboxylesterase